jgi:hypothetical protein
MRDAVAARLRRDGDAARPRDPKQSDEIENELTTFRTRIAELDPEK